MIRLYATIVAAFLFAMLFSWFGYVPSSDREPNVYYSGFFETAILVIIYAGLVYLFFGLPLSILIDAFSRKFHNRSKLFRYFVRLGLYSLAGIMVGFAYALLLLKPYSSMEVFLYTLLGLIASNLGYHTLLLLTYIQQRKL